MSSAIQWGDGQTSEIAGGWRPSTALAQTTHRYAAAGLYSIVYTEIAPDGSPRQASAPIEVLDQPIPPVVTLPKRTRVEPIAPTRSISFFRFGGGRVKMISTDFATGATTAREAPELLQTFNYVSPDARFLFRMLPVTFDPPVITLQAFRVEQDLSLTPWGPARTVEGTDIVFSPTGHTLYVLGYPLMIHAYAFDSSTGFVGEKTGSCAVAGGDAFYAGLQDAAIDPTGEWMLARAPDWPMPSLAVIRLDPQTGAVLSQRRVVLDASTQFGPSGDMIAMHPGWGWLAVSGTGEFLDLSLLRFDRSSGDVTAATRIASPPRTSIGGTYHSLLTARWGAEHLYLGATYAWQSSLDRAAGGVGWTEVYQSVMNVNRLAFDAGTGVVSPAVSTQWLQARPRYANEPSGYYNIRSFGGNLVERMIISPTVQSVLGCQWGAAGDWGGRIDLVSYTIAPGAAAQPWLTQRSLAMSEPAPLGIFGYCE